MYDIEDIRKEFKYENGLLINLKTNKTAKSYHGEYVRVRYAGKSIAAHRIIFFMHYGYLPRCIDHINGIRTDNRIENLREATHKQNAQNRKKAKNNTSGVKGVSWCKRSERWRAVVQNDGKYINLGYFKNFCDAKKRSDNYRKSLHGDFYREC